MALACTFWPALCILRNLQNLRTETHHRIFLLDGAGAILSAFLTGVVLVRWEAYFGIPPSVLYILAGLALGLAAFDAWAYARPVPGSARPLRTIALLNVGYCLLSLILAAIHRESLLPLAYVYLGLECLIVGILASVEWRLASRIS